MADDFTHALGDPAEARLAAALGYRLDQGCPPATSATATAFAARDLSATEGVAHKSPWRENRIFRRLIGRRS